MWTIEQCANNFDVWYELIEDGELIGEIFDAQKAALICRRMNEERFTEVEWDHIATEFAFRAGDYGNSGYDEAEKIYRIIAAKARRMRRAADD